LLGLILAGCAAAGVVESNDPAVKIRQAVELYNRQGRYMPAKRLFDEAMTIYQAKGDELGVAEVHRQLGFYYQSHFPKSGPVLLPDDFTGTTGGIENRYLIAMEHFEKALALFTKHKQFDTAANVYYSMGTNYYLGQKNVPAACAAFDKTLEANSQAQALNPNRVVNLPAGVRSYADFMAQTKRQVGCP
jgi:tetratricopeptide (TPR) repeat protein